MSDIFGSLAPETDMLMVSPRNPARMPQGIEDIATGMTTEPIADAIKALRGQMTPTEAQNFAMTAAMGLFSPMARGVKLPPRIGISQAPVISGKGVPEIIGATSMSAPHPIDMRGPWGQSPPPIIRGAGAEGRGASETDTALAAIQDALKAHGVPNSGVPLISQAGGSRSTNDVLALIEEALKLAPRKE